MSKLFPEGFVYPQDDVGSYIELTGTVTEVGDSNYPEDEVQVTVQTKEGVFSGFTPRPPKVGYYARIRIYAAGGGWYPDNRIVGWSKYHDGLNF